MLKMIIVEDEKLAREGLVEFFDWNSLEIEIAGTACDGIEGIELAEKTKPDIIITDIKMPGMDGLSMSKKIKSFLPQTKIIILSGYDDFKYAKEAIGFNVSAYILKPVEQEEMLNIVKNLVRECKKSQHLEIMLKEQYYNEKRNLCINLLDGKIEKLETRISDFGINLNSKYQFVIVAIKPLINEKELLDTLNFNTNNISNENVEFIVTYEEENTAYVCVNIVNKDNEAVDSLCKSILIQNVNDEHSYSIGVGTAVASIYAIKKSFEAAKQALKYGLFWSDQEVIYFKDIFCLQKDNCEQIGNFITLGNKFSKELIHLVGFSEDDKVKEKLKEIFDFINQNKQINKKYIINYLYNVINETSLLLYSLEKNNQRHLTERNDFGTQLLELENFKMICEYTYDFFEKATKLLNERRNNKEEYVIKTVIKLIEERYMTGINLKVIALEVYVSPNYLGNIFKKYTGKYFNDFLSEFRMEKAKELLKNPSKKISVIAKEIGISNTSYFCMVFKNIYGMAPKEYREMLLRN